MYSDRNKKALAYTALINKCREVDPQGPQANKDFVTNKINSFRTVYCKECAKIKSSICPLVLVVMTSTRPLCGTFTWILNSIFEQKLISTYTE